ncbi:MAG: cation-transporting P-type ATPase [Syntrophotaleaceae bacterium]
MIQNRNISLPQKPWTLSSRETADRLNVSPDQGLSQQEVAKRREAFGDNRLREKEKASVWRIFVNQFKSLVIVILAVASLVAFLFGKGLEGFAIGIVLVINGFIGFFTELKARRSMEALQQLGEVQARVLREGQEREVPARELVPGDLVLVEGGDIIPADLRIIEADHLQVDESALTGESVPVRKGDQAVEEETDLADRTCMLFKGTALTTGSGRGVVIATGMETEIGQVASLTDEAEQEGTPLEKRLARLGRRLVLLTVLMGVIVAAAGVIGGKDWVLVLETAIAMAVAAVPEGMPIVATMALARGMWRMAERNALINRLSAVDTLGATTVICSDKTGTLTENRMTVSLIALNGGEVQVDQDALRMDGQEIELSAKKTLKKALEAGVLCTNAELEEEKASGDPMETALLRAGLAGGVNRKELLDRMPEIREEAFSTETKMMATFHQAEEGVLVAVKGAPEEVLKVATRVLTEDGEKELNEQGRREWLDRNTRLAEEGLRLLALAGKTVAEADADPYEDLILYGLAGLLDPPRQDVKSTLEECRAAGIRVVMVTGDQPATARGIAKALGMEVDEEKALRGAILKRTEDLSEEEKKKILRASIFARLSPAQKLTLIDLHQKNGEVVAMTGDGVNDAPALRKADIGVAMGQRGTQVAREAADMVLKDDRFGSIVAAVRYGRVIFDNIRKFIYYLISGNVSEVLIITVAILIGMPLPLLPLQILYINIIGDVFPALALGLGGAPPGVMDRPPRDPRESLLTRSHWIGIGGYALVFTAAVVGVFALALYFYDMPSEKAVTVSFSALVLARLWHVFNMRASRAAFFVNEVTGNGYIWAALALGISLLLMAIYIPALSTILGLQPPTVQMWMLILGGSLFPLVVGQAAKLRQL